MSKAYGPLLRHGARRGLPTKAGFSRGPGARPRGVTAPSRRDVLRTGTGLAAALLGPGLAGLAGCASRGGQGARGRRPGFPGTVIVVGAGFAGLACADTLAHAGVNVIVLEAAARPGGRVLSNRAFIPGDVVEFGGEWIGANHPTWLAYAQEFNLRLEEPGGAPLPEDPAAQPTEPGEAPAEGGTEPGPANETPRPEPFETEMEVEGAGARGAGRVPGAAVRLIAFQDEAPAGEQPADEADAPAPDAPAPDAPGPDAAMQESPAEDPQAPDLDEPVKPAPGPDPAPAEAAEAEAEEPIIINGKLVRGEEADQLYEEVDGVLAKLIEMARGINPVRPWTSPNAEELDNRSFADFVKEQQLGDVARALLLSTEEADNGVSPERMSLLAYLSMVAGGGFQDYYEVSETYRIADGNDALALALAQKLGNRVRFASPVEAIRRAEEGIFVRARGGEIYRGDALVLAIPPSVWQRIEFFPPLPEPLTPQMGSNVKLILKLSAPLWEKYGLTSEAVSITTGDAAAPAGEGDDAAPVGALPEDAPGDRGPGTSPEGAGGTEDGAGEGVPTEQDEQAKQDLAAEGGPGDDAERADVPQQDPTDAAVLGRTGLLGERGRGRPWVGITWAATEPTGRGPVALTVFSGAEHAEALRRREPADRNAWVLDSLEPAYPALPEVMMDGRFIDWPGFPITRASYSFPAPGQVTAFGPVLVNGLGGPGLGDNLPPLLFAGEHTSFAFIGYMEGALSSGVRVARMLLGTEPRDVEATPAVPSPNTTPTDPAPAEVQTAPEGAEPPAAPADPAPVEMEPVPTPGEAPQDGEPAPAEEMVEEGTPAY